MTSTTSGFASVVVSPTSLKLEIPAMTRRIIFPERVFGMSGTIQTFLGRAILPIAVSIALATFCSMWGPETTPGLTDTYISTARPLSSSITGTAAASAISDPDARRLQLLRSETVPGHVAYVVHSAED